MTHHKINYTKPTCKTYVRHRRQGQFIGFHFLIALLKQATDSKFLILTGISSQILMLDGITFQRQSNGYCGPRMKLSFIISGESPITIL